MMRRNKRKKINFSKILMYLLSIMVVVGFTLPGFLELGEPVNQGKVIPCTSDAACYLDCDGQPVPVLCFQNHCQRTHCTQQPTYNFRQEPLTFELELILSGELINVSERSNPEDIFVKFDQNQAQLFSSGLDLEQVIDKLALSFRDDTQVFVGGELVYAQKAYLPQEGDQIKVIFT